MDDSQNRTLIGQMCDRELEFSPRMQKYNQENPRIALWKENSKSESTFLKITKTRRVCP